MQLNIQSIPTHIITGFLGAGKTTVLKALLQQKPKDEVWAVLMNEFGEIGIDQTWIADEGIAVKEVLGGCLCCTSQLPMQIALARLLSEYKPTRLWIEPTGLGHPRQLLEQLSESHWQQSLSLRQVVTIIDGHRLHEQLWLQHDIFLQQLDVADIVLISHHQEMTETDIAQLEILQRSYASFNQQWIGIDYGHIALSTLDVKHQPIHIKKQTLLTQQPTTQINQVSKEPKTLPYHYHSSEQGYQAAGWCMPKSWQFDADQLLAVLQNIPSFERIKAKIHTNHGWIDINAIPSGFHVDFAAKAGLDNRLEVISRLSQDWLSVEQRIMQSRF